jgi:Fibronectin type III domain
VSTAAANDFGTMINELQAKGYTRTDRKYLVWSDANVYCGIAQVYGDDSPGQTNLSNGSTRVSGEFARVDNGCWGLAGQSVEAHELMHTMGGVQTSAPHATRFNHCWDTSDRMCYADGSGSVMRQICPTSHENVLDCNHDDYFYAGTPPTGNYLATHWNTADSVFLTGSDGSSSPPQPSAPTTTAPSAPRTVTATAPATGGVKLTWQPPSNTGGAALTGYDVYRGTSSGSYTLVRSLPKATRTWRDRTTTSGTTYYYVVEAKNAVGSSPNSNEASATPR